MAEEVKDAPQEGEGSKTKQKFDKNLGKLIALFSGSQDVLKKKRGRKSVFDTAIQELVKEKQEKLVTDFKEKAGKLLERKVEFDKFVTDQRKAMEQAVEKKMEEFNKEMNDVFQMVEDIDEMTRQYENSLKAS